MQQTYTSLLKCMQTLTTCARHSEEYQFGYHYLALRVIIMILEQRYREC